VRLQWKVACMAVTMLAVISFAAGSVGAAATKVGFINMQKVLANSDAGKAAQKAMEKKMKELKASFKKEEDALLALKKEIEKKSSAWSEEKKQEKAIEFQKKRRDLGMKQEDANLELKRLREKHIGPILKKLEVVIQEVAKKEGYTMIFPRSAIVYAADSVDLTSEIIKALNAKMK